MASSFKKLEVKLKLLIDINILLIAEKEIRGGICHTIYWYAKVNNKYMKILIKINNNHILNIGM